MPPVAPQSTLCQRFVRGVRRVFAIHQDTGTNTEYVSQTKSSERKNARRATKGLNPDRSGIAGELSNRNNKKIKPEVQSGKTQRDENIRKSKVKRGTCTLMTTTQSWSNVNQLYRDSPPDEQHEVVHLDNTLKKLMNTNQYHSIEIKRHRSQPMKEYLLIPHTPAKKTQLTRSSRKTAERKKKIRLVEILHPISLLDYSKIPLSEFIDQMLQCLTDANEPEVTHELEALMTRIRVSIERKIKVQHKKPEVVWLYGRHNDLRRRHDDLRRRHDDLRRRHSLNIQEVADACRKPVAVTRKRLHRKGVPVERLECIPEDFENGKHETSSDVLSCNRLQVSVKKSNLWKNIKQKGQQYRDAYEATRLERRECAGQGRIDDVELQGMLGLAVAQEKDTCEDPRMGTYINWDVGRIKRAKGNRECIEKKYSSTGRYRCNWQNTASNGMKSNKCFPSSRIEKSSKSGVVDEVNQRAKKMVIISTGKANKSIKLRKNCRNQYFREVFTAQSAKKNQDPIADQDSQKNAGKCIDFGKCVSKPIKLKSQVTKSSASNVVSKNVWNSLKNETHVTDNVTQLSQHKFLPLSPITQQRLQIIDNNSNPTNNGKTNTSPVIKEVMQIDKITPSSKNSNIVKADCFENRGHLFDYILETVTNGTELLQNGEENTTLGTTQEMEQKDSLERRLLLSSNNNNGLSETEQSTSRYMNLNAITSHNHLLAVIGKNSKSRDTCKLRVKGTKKCQPDNHSEITQIEKIGKTTLSKRKSDNLITKCIPHKKNFRKYRLIKKQPLTKVVEPIRKTCTSNNIPVREENGSNAASASSEIVSHTALVQDGAGTVPTPSHDVEDILFVESIQNTSSSNAPIVAEAKPESSTREHNKKANRTIAKSHVCLSGSKFKRNLVKFRTCAKYKLVRPDLNCARPARRSLESQSSSSIATNNSFSLSPLNPQTFPNNPIVQFLKVHYFAKPTIRNTSGKLNPVRLKLELDSADLERKLQGENKYGACGMETCNGINIRNPNFLKGDIKLEKLSSDKAQQYNLSSIHITKTTKSATKHDKVNESAKNIVPANKGDTVCALRRVHDDFTNVTIPKVHQRNLNKEVKVPGTTQLGTSNLGQFDHKLAILPASKQQNSRTTNCVITRTRVSANLRPQSKWHQVDVRSAIKALKNKPTDNLEEKIIANTILKYNNAKEEEQASNWQRNIKNIPPEHKKYVLKYIGTNSTTEDSSEISPEENLPISKPKKRRYKQKTNILQNNTQNKMSSVCSRMNRRNYSSSTTSSSNSLCRPRKKTHTSRYIQMVLETMQRRKWRDCGDNFHVNAEVLKRCAERNGVNYSEVVSPKIPNISRIQQFTSSNAYSNIPGCRRTHIMETEKIYHNQETTEKIRDVILDKNEQNKCPKEVEIGGTKIDKNQANLRETFPRNPKVSILNPTTLAATSRSDKNTKYENRAQEIVSNRKHNESSIGKGALSMSRETPSKKKSISFNETVKLVKDERCFVQRGSEQRHSSVAARAAEQVRQSDAVVGKRGGERKSAVERKSRSGDPEGRGREGAEQSILKKSMGRAKVVPRKSRQSLKGKPMETQSWSARLCIF